MRKRLRLGLTKPVRLRLPEEPSKKSSTSESKRMGMRKLEQCASCLNFDCLSHLLVKEQEMAVEIGALVRELFAYAGKILKEWN